MSERPREVHPITWRVLGALRAGARLSRNRHFYLFQDPRAREAKRLHRFLGSLVQDVRRNPGDVHVERVGEGEGRYALRIEIPHLGGRRTAYLAQFELELLAADAPEVARLLTEAAASG